MPYAHLFAALSASLESVIAQSGYALLFVFTLLEGIPLVGMAVPGHISVIIAGFFAKIGVLSLFWVLVISTTGAILGDYIGFLLGRRYGMAFITRLRPYFFITNAHIEKARSLLHKHTGKAMVIGRFMPATRALLPFLVGCSHTKAGRFWFFNVIGGVSWTVLSVLVGYVFGTGYHAVAGYFGRFATIAVVAAILIIWGYRFVNTRFHIFKRFELITLGLNVLSIWGFFGTVDLLTEKSYKLGFDVWVSSVMDVWNHAHPAGVALARVFSAIGDPGVLSIVGILCGIWFFFKKKWRSAAIMLISIGSTAVAVGILKSFFMVARPGNALFILSDSPSFPSSHAATAAALFIAAAYVFAPKIRSWVKRELILVLGVVLVITIGLSRTVLNVHWASDVIAGWTLGVFMSTASILFVRYAASLFVPKGGR